MTVRTAIHLIVFGRVQGVGYRYWAIGEARGLGLDGWVRNRHDGSVEILAIGAEAQLDLLETACRRGPSAAMVRNVTRRPAIDDGSRGFEAKATA